VLGYSPLQGGLGYLHFGFAIAAGMGIGTALMPRVASNRSWSSASSAPPRG
jgi:hypothetical protein